MSSAMVRSISSTAFAQLTRRLRRTNARYDHLARQIRCRIHRTYHAERRAYRAGLRIDTSKARACPDKYVSVHPPPVLDRSACTPSWMDPTAPSYSPADVEIALPPLALGEEYQEDAYMRGAPLKNLPEVVVRSRRCGGQPRVVLRLPPLKLQLNVDYVCATGASHLLGPAPGAPRLSPKQLPEECGTEAIVPESLTAVDRPDSSLLAFDVQVYSGLCITIPPCSLKRKFQDMEGHEDVTQQPKRFLRTRWNEYENH